MIELKPIYSEIEQEYSPLFIVNGRFYELSPARRTASTNYIEIAQQRWPLIPSLPFSEFERITTHQQQAQVIQFQQEYIQQQLQTQIRLHNESLLSQGLKGTLEFIMFSLLPHIVARKYKSGTDLDDLFESQESQSARAQEFEKALLEVKERLGIVYPTSGKTGTKDIDIAEEKRNALIISLQKELNLGAQDHAIQRKRLNQQSAQNISPSILGDITNYEPRFIAGDVMYHLSLKPSQSNDQIDFTHCSIDNILYYASDSSNTRSSIFKDVEHRRIKGLRVDALTKSQEQFAKVKGEFRTLTEDTNSITKLLSTESYDHDGAGFIKKGETIYFYVTVPKFATQDGRNEKVFWPYDATKIAIKVGSRDKKVYTYDHPVAIEDRVTHPIMYNRTSKGGFHDICELDRENYSGDPIVAMLRKLNDAVNAFTHPLNKEGLDRHPGESYFGYALKEILTQTPLTREEAIMQGYYIHEVIASADAKMTAKKVEQK